MRSSSINAVAKLTQIDTNNSSLNLLLIASHEWGGKRSAGIEEVCWSCGGRDSWKLCAHDVSIWAKTRDEMVIAYSSGESRGQHSCVYRNRYVTKKWKMEKLSRIDKVVNGYWWGMERIERYDDRKIWSREDDWQRIWTLVHPASVPRAEYSRRWEHKTDIRQYPRTSDIKTPKKFDADGENTSFPF